MGSRLKGKNAVVTGAGAGIGKAIAFALAAEGAKVVANDVQATPPKEVADEIKATGGVAIASCGSVADFSYTARLIRTCVDNFGSIDVLVNNAGIPGGATILEETPEDWQRLINVHLNGTFNCCKHAAPLMVQQRSGRIINFSSGVSLGAYGGCGYAAAKGGITSLTLAMARDLQECGVTCNVVFPAAKTGMSSGEDRERWLKGMLAKGWMSETDLAINLPGPEFIAPLVLFLATDEAADITGQQFAVTGGHIGVYPHAREFTLVNKDHEKLGAWTVDELVKVLHSRIEKYSWF